VVEGTRSHIHVVPEFWFQFLQHVLPMMPN
jgi:hypothetical protein